MDLQLPEHWSNITLSNLQNYQINTLDTERCLNAVEATGPALLNFVLLQDQLQIICT